ncbi:WD40 repeat-like protein [Hyaloscypha variabilis F]|uniref:WD40 repeat-like protein n=1 Tax=Hyaloscypha variabilis (strain UAMH 11265 / GT02V1 / F) TaxID=1149755 RepID=A0A2J6R5E1_HYAVF|nr:WD40 repeat-like protein [Hyaloscypha variabilis F]
MSLRHDHLLDPITALEFHRTRTGTLLVLAGEGSFLKIFHAEEAKVLHQCEIFHGQIIHGIVVRDDVDHQAGLQVVIWGGSSLTLLSNQEFDQILNQNVSSIANTAISVSDWILDVAICPFDAVSAVFITAHNTVIRARLGQPLHVPVMETLQSPSRSILYSAHLTWESLSCVMVAAGTVFGEIIVWQCSPSGETSETSQVLFTFTGHEGSIFGVNISPRIIGIRGVTRLLASCSDDRTIRVWNLSEDARESLLPATAVLARETGFGENGVPTEHTDSKCSPLAIVMGHASRIWRVTFLGHQSAPLDSCALSVLSFGEDSTVQQWDLHIEQRLQTSAILPEIHARLDQSHTFAFHNGKHIWSAALCQRDGSETILATGGADGKISMYDIRKPDHPTAIETPSLDAAAPLCVSRQTVSNDLSCRSWELGEILESPALRSLVDSTVDQQTSKSSSEILQEAIDIKSVRTTMKKAFKDSFNRYAFVSENELLATTTSGRVLLCHIGSEIHWSEVSLPECGAGDLQSYAVLVGLPEIGLACLAGANGSLYVYRLHQRLLKVGQVGGKVADLFKLYNSRNGSFELLVTTLGGANPTLFFFDLPRSQARITSNPVHDLPSKFVVTSAGKVGNILIMGSRSGSLALYDSESPESPPQIWLHSPGPPRDAITSIVSLPRSNDSNHNNAEYFLTTSRDGLYSVFSMTVFRDISVAMARIVVRQVHHGAPPIGPLIENSWFEDEKLFLYGFKGKNFVVWNETEQCEVTSVECGGSHRSFAYSPVRGSGHGYFVYTKASKMYLRSHQKLSHNILKAGGHGREIKACAISGDHILIATGAEDTTIRIWEYNKPPSSQNPVICNAVIQKHSAGIQHLQWHGSQYLFSSGGNEEFFVWAVERIPGFGVGVICEAACPDPSSDKDLRIMNFHVTALPNSSVLSTDTRLLISLAYSDSTIRNYIYSRRDAFHLLCTGRYTSACITQIRHVSLESDRFYILTTATDGRLALWEGIPAPNPSNSVLEPLELALLTTQRLHQNAIKSLDVARLKDQILVATGGDDNALGLSVYPIPGTMVTSTPTSYILRSAHAAAVTGLCFLRSSDTASGNGSLKLASSSNDQKLAVWSIEQETHPSGDFRLDIRRIEEAFTPVADVGDVAALAANKNCSEILVVGNGMEIWKVAS